MSQETEAMDDWSDMGAGEDYDEWERERAERQRDEANRIKLLVKKEVDKLNKRGKLGAPLPNIVPGYNLFIGVKLTNGRTKQLTVKTIDSIFESDTYIVAEVNRQFVENFNIKSSQVAGKVKDVFTFFENNPNEQYAKFHIRRTNAYCKWYFTRMIK